MDRAGNLLKRFKPLAFIILIPLLVVAHYVNANEPVANEPSAEPSGLKLEIEPTKQIYSIREGLVMKFIFTAQSKTKLCLNKDILSQMQINISKPGLGKMALKPLVIKDNSQIFQQPMKVQWLDSGEKLTLRANLKRFQFDNGENWAPGEYSVGAVFNLCEQTPAMDVTETGVEIPVKAARKGWFMIMI